MTELFLDIVNMSISAGWLVLAVLVLRLILKKAPKWVNVLLWGIVAVRLICPFSIESGFSLMPEDLSSGALVKEWTDDYIGHNHFINEDSDYYDDAIAAGKEPIPDGEGGHYVATGADRISEPSTVRNAVVPKLAIVWGIGMSLMAVYTVVSYLSLRHKLRTSVILRDNIFQCETVSSPFVLGTLKPRIYLPYNTQEQNLNYVIAHEQAHIRRKDHWWKPLGFLLLTIHWFNPLMWVAYILLCRDIELACDEKVIAELDNEQRADYTQALVACAVNRRMIAACPLAFGEVGVKERVKSVMDYKKPTFWIIVTALVVCVVVALCFLTNPKDIKTPMHIINTLSTEDVQWSQITIWEDESTHILLTDEQIQDLMGILKDLDDRDFLRSRGIERNVSLMINCGEIELLLHWDGEYTAFYFDAATHELVDQEYSYVKSNELNLFLSQFYPIQVGTSRPEVKWFDYTEDHSAMSYEEELKIQLDEFPGITFKYTPYDIIASTSWADNNAAGKTYLISGLPIWNAYFYDLTGDGKPEICSQVSFGSGIIDSRVIIYDYANGVSYSLADRGYHDYYLRMNEDDGYLYVDKRLYRSDELVSSGRLAYKDGCIMVEETDIRASRIMLPTDTKLQGLHAGALLLPIDGNTYRYLLTDNTGEGVTAEKRLFEFTESDLNRTINWEVYSLKEYPDLSVVMILSKEEGPWLFTYSPPGGCSDTALYDAINAGHIVMEDGAATHGQDVWNAFYDKTQQGKPASVTVAHYYTLDPERCDSAYYETYSQDYPCLYEYRLEYDGKTFTLTEPDGNDVRVRTFAYLMRYDNTEFYPKSSTLPGRRFDYVLTHDNMVTWEQLFNGLVSSQMGAYIDHYSIYSERIQ